MKSLTELSGGSKSGPLPDLYLDYCQADILGQVACKIVHRYEALFDRLDRPWKHPKSNLAVTKRMIEEECKKVEIKLIHANRMDDSLK